MHGTSQAMKVWLVCCLLSRVLVFCGKSDMDVPGTREARDEDQVKYRTKTR